MSAGRLYTETGQELEAIKTVLNRAVAAFRSGDLPAALSLLDEAASRYPTAECADAHSSASIDARYCWPLGWSLKHLTETDAAIRDIEQAHGWSTKKAELLLTAANCALAAAQPQGALDRAEAAYRLFRSQQNTWGQAHARLVLVQARYAVGPISAPAAACVRTRPPSGWMNLAPARQLRRICWPGEWPWTWVAATTPIVICSAAAQSRRRGPAMARASGWLAEALRAEAAVRATPNASRLPPRP